MFDMSYPFYGKNYIKDAYEYILACVYPEKNTKIRLWNLGDSIQSKKIATNIVANSNCFQAIISKYRCNNLCFSSSTFYCDASKYTENNISTIKTIAIDIDYKNNKEWENVPPLHILELLKMDNFLGLPFPNYVEYGNQLRLIYVLDKPIFLPKNKNRTNMCSLIKRIMQVWCRKLNEEMGLFAEPMKLNGYYRIPGSINTKSGDIVHICRLNESYFSFQEILDEYMPDLPEWYYLWKKKTKKQSKKTYYNPNQHNCHVITSLEILQEKFNQKKRYSGFREVMCWIYYAYQLLVNDENVARRNLIEFNEKFIFPLREREISSITKNTHKGIRLKNDTIFEKLGITKEEAIFYQLPMVSSNAMSLEQKKEKDKIRHAQQYKKNRKRLEKKGETRKQKDAKKRNDIFCMIQKGCSRKEIANKHNISKQMVHKYIQKYNDFIKLKKETRIKLKNVIQKLNKRKKEQHSAFDMFLFDVINSDIFFAPMVNRVSLPYVGLSNREEVVP